MIAGPGNFSPGLFNYYVLDITCGLFLYSTPVKKFLIGHATASRDQWSIPKGLKEKDDDEFETAVRELYEETSIDLEKINIRLSIRLEPVKYLKQKKILQSFLVISNDDLTVKPLVCNSKTKEGYPEIDKFRWVGLKDLVSLAHQSQAEAIGMVPVDLFN